MRMIAGLLLLLAPALAGGDPWQCVPDAATAVEIARTRGKLIFLTVIVDNDAENRAFIGDSLKDKALQALLEEFVCLYANPDDTHGKKQVKGTGGKPAARCADCPSIECRDHQLLAQKYARGFYGDRQVRTPVHFVLDAKEDLLETIFEGDFNSGLGHVPAKTIAGKLTLLLKKHGRGLNETQYKKMQEDLTTAKAARARNNTVAELTALVSVLALDRDIDGVREARARMAEIDKVALVEVEKARALVAAAQWEEAIDAFEAVPRSFPGTPSAAISGKEEADLRARPEVRNLLAAKECYTKAMAFLDRKAVDQARKKFEECIRRWPGTRYAGLSKDQLARMPS